MIGNIILGGAMLLTCLSGPVGENPHDYSGAVRFTIEEVTSGTSNKAMDNVFASEANLFLDVKVKLENHSDKVQVVRLSEFYLQDPASKKSIRLLTADKGTFKKKPKIGRKHLYDLTIQPNTDGEAHIIYLITKEMEPSFLVVHEEEYKFDYTRPE